MEVGMQSAVSVPYIGSKIALISNVDIRYEGVLHSIDTFNSTVALYNVRSFGTEGRRHPDVAPSAKSYSYIIFKGKDIKDLTVCEPATNRIPDDPAVVSVNIPPSSAHQSGMMQNNQSMQHPPMDRHFGNTGQMMNNQGPYGNRDYYGGPGGHPNMGRPNHYNMNSHQGANQMRHPVYPQHAQMNVPMRGGYGNVHMDVDGGMASRGRPRGGRGGRGGGRRIVGELAPQPNQAVKKELSTAFDFESSNAKFDKTEAKTENKAENGENAGTEHVANVGYNKAASFFDRISCETSDRAAGQDSRVDRDKQRLLDQETFGGAAANMPRGGSYRRGYARGRGRGYSNFSRGSQRYIQSVTIGGGGGGGGGFGRY
eukprot:Lankesteria_metandrocarpae@DN4487_c0_g1_i2.p1